MRNVKYILFSVLFLLAACGRAPQEQDKAAQQQPAAPEPAAVPEAPPAPEAQAETPQSAAQDPAARPSQRSATERPRSTAPAKRPADVESTAPISRSDAQSDTRAASGVVPPTRSTDVAPSNVAPEPARPRVAVVASGTKLNVRLTDAVGTDTNKTGDKFEATLDEDLVVDGRVIASRGSVVTGKVVEADQGGRVEGRASLALALTGIQTKTASYPIRTNTLTFTAESSKKKDATKIGAGAGIGAVIGAIAGGGKGAAIGAAVGGGAGTGAVLATRGKAVAFPSEHQFEFSLRDDLQVKLQ